LRRRSDYYHTVVEQAGAVDADQMDIGGGIVVAVRDRDLELLVGVGLNRSMP